MTTMALLAADDDPAVRQLLRRLVAVHSQHRVEFVQDGGEALDALARARYAGVLLDIDMPVLNGLSVAKAVRGDPATRHLPIFVITGTSDGDMVSAFRELDVFDYMLKPINPIAAGPRIAAFIRECEYYHRHHADVA
jgi:PleD family two-component response regulator